MHTPSLKLAYSRHLAAFLSITHVAGIILVIFMAFQSAFPPETAIVLIITCVLMLCHELRYNALKTNSGAIIGLQWHPDHACWLLRDRKGNQYAAQLMPGCVMTSFLIILHFKENERRRQKSVIILPDTITSDDWRRLRVFLRFHESRGSNA